MIMIGSLTDVVYLDTAKAFDTVSHPKFISKLKKLEFHGLLLHLIFDLLSDRFQRVYIGENYSDRKMVTCGVPQDPN